MSLTLNQPIYLMLLSFKPPHDLARKFIGHEKFCMQNNKLPTKSHVELEDEYHTCEFDWAYLCLYSIATLSF